MLAVFFITTFALGFNNKRNCMKQRMLKGLVILFAGAAVLSACTKDEMKGDAYISFTLSSDYSYYSMNRLTEDLKSAGDDIFLPDTNDFILTVTGPDGEPVYKGPYGERPDPMQVSAGTYDVSLHSIEFDEPAYASPQFGDFRTVVLNNGQTLSVAFGCTQLNCGMRLIFTDSFRDRFFSSEVSIRSEDYSLTYPYTEFRIAYFLPGILSVVCTEDSNEIPILSRRLNAADILTIKLSASAESADSFSIEIDTARNWLYEDFTLGSGNDGSTMEKALQVTDLPLSIGAKDVWVVGYIVGGDVTTSKVNFTPPFEEISNLAVSDNPDAASRAECAAVQLSSGEIRDALNLVNNPDNVGRRLYIKGDIEEYYGSAGVKNIKEFQLE